MARRSYPDFSSLALSYLEELTAYARRLSRNAWDADDLVQATYERAFRGWKGLREPARCRAWLFRIARNLHLDRVRTATARPEIHLVESGYPEADAAVISPEAVERLSARELEAALARLPEEQRHVVLLCDLWGFPYDEIAEIAGVPVGTVRSRIARGRLALSKLLIEGGNRARRRGPS
ncbi:sigma-70 family RNA polymerase sigma factor [Candidatus Binatia bacterium]|nr:sigma-70 family RNA polymerase sigma factor [Candidatus Binatia bacterium]